jgi:hypothetical protein
MRFLRALVKKIFGIRVDVFGTRLSKQWSRMGA